MYNKCPKDCHSLLLLLLVGGLVCRWYKSIIVATGHSYMSLCQVLYYIVQTCMIRMHPGSQGDGICSELDTPADLADFDPVTTNQWSLDQ